MNICENSERQHKHSGQGTRLSAADLARLLAVSAQQVSRWKSDGVFSFGVDGMVNALDAIRAVFSWARHGRTPKATQHLRERARGADYWRGMADGLAMMGRVAAYHREQAQAKTPTADADADAFTLPPLDGDAMQKEFEAAQRDFDRIMDEIGLIPCREDVETSPPDCNGWRRRCLTGATASTAPRLPGGLGDGGDVGQPIA